MPRDSMKSALVGVLILAGVVLSGCAPPSELAGPPAESKPGTAKAHNTAATEPASSGTPTLTVAATASPKQAAYETEIASWPEPLPPGYSWPAWTDLPHLEAYGVGDFAQADNASGVYRCILVDAAWHAYFEADDPMAARDYATRADSYVIPGNQATEPVTQDGLIVDDELARASGICRGIAGDLVHD